MVLLQMGHAAAEALVAAGFELVPYTFSGMSSGVAVANIGIRGTPVQVRPGLLWMDGWHLDGGTQMGCWCKLCQQSASSRAC